MTLEQSQCERLGHLSTRFAASEALKRHEFIAHAYGASMRQVARTLQTLVLMRPVPLKFEFCTCALRKIKAHRFTHMRMQEL